MRGYERTTIRPGYQGPVQIVTTEGSRLVTAYADYYVEVSHTGLTGWRGTLTRIEPQFTLQAAEYRLKLANGNEGTILIDNLRFGTTPERATFVGSGPYPSLNDDTS